MEVLANDKKIDRSYTPGGGWLIEKTDIEKVFQQVVNQGFLTVKEKERAILKTKIIESTNGILFKDRGGKTIDKKKKSI